MVKATITFLGCLFISPASYAGPTSLSCEASSKFESNLNELTKVIEETDTCPAPTKDQFTNVCNSIYERKTSSDESKFGDKYQEDLWQLSCADPKIDSIETANTKIQKMWNKNRERFRCYGYTGVSVSDSNIAKFSIDTGFSSFLVTAVKKYKLDMNFKDPADGKTLMDFLESQRDSYKNSTYTSKYEEYDRIYKLMAKSGAKHGKDL